MQNSDQEFLEYVVKMLVDNPSDVKVNRQVDEMGVLLTLDVNAADMGKVIGRSGNTAKAIRILLRVVGMKNNARVNLKINEPAGSTRGMGGGMGMGSSSSSMGMSEGSQGAASRGIDEALEDLKL
ncbi:hypothetical protein A2841_01095 [Candidatus Kaiserbacteria bacterium RIFCSPHIGHO2_01_FULL_48_10]|uniref:RNA-binding protein KhpA n=1 Tax=Candidatus Kaiserbacteria bacterium RIFCSPHIGHO2_01_FULL_48_10 TaxID=1798476 RepID=A0A1F6C620_9BACT|nr:MAG: hypothetical protein A2841_01095 [Candidatus Kaiserbacteria bacterium RIFCSPHIGHO2_01_FULL_48_10]